PRQADERLLIAGRRERVEPRDELADRFVPAHGLEVAAAAVAVPLQRLRDAIGVIRDLDRRLAARTQPPVADRILGLAFELLRDAHRADAGLAVAHGVDGGLHHADGDGAAGSAGRADTRLRFGDAGREILVRHEANQLVLGAPAARERDARAGDRRKLDEVPTLHADSVAC